MENRCHNWLGSLATHQDLDLLPCFLAARTNRGLDSRIRSGERADLQRFYRTKDSNSHTLGRFCYQLHGGVKSNVLPSRPSRGYNRKLRISETAQKGRQRLEANLGAMGQDNRDIGRAI